jgi:hypothetical protein
MDYVVVPPALVADGAALRDWVGRALEYTSTLPAKEKKPPGGKRHEARVPSPSGRGLG